MAILACGLPGTRYHVHPILSLFTSLQVQQSSHQSESTTKSAFAQVWLPSSERIVLFSIQFIAYTSSTPAHSSQRFFVRITSFFLSLLAKVGQLQSPHLSALELPLPRFDLQHSSSGILVHNIFATFTCIHPNVINISTTTSLLRITSCFLSFWVAGVSVLFLSKPGDHHIRGYFAHYAWNFLSDQPASSE